MGEHGSCVRHKPLDGPALRAAIHALPSGSVFDRAAELERMEGSAIDQRTCNVSDDFFGDRLSSADAMLQIYR